MADRSRPAVSIVLPLYNGDRFLDEQLTSILNQSWRDFELLIQDDGSSDGTLEIAGRFAQADRRISLLPSQGNRGQKLRLIELIAASRSPLIAVSDQDDIWHPQKLEYLVSSLGDAALAFGRSELIDENGRSLGRTLLEANRAPPRCRDRLSLLFRPRVSGHALVARREVFAEAAFRSPEPYDWLLSLNAGFSRGIAYDERAVVYHRLHSGNSYNDAVLARINPLGIRPWHLQRALRRIRGQRVRFVAGAEFLSQSGIVPIDTRSAFRQVADQCRAAWLLSSNARRPSAFKLQRSILEALEPFAGSRRDWNATVRWVRFLSFGSWLSKV